MTPELQSRLDEVVKSNKIVVFMKGSKLMPQCGFSNNAVQILNSLGAPYETVDVLQDADIRQGIKEHANWPTAKTQVTRPVSWTAIHAERLHQDIAVRSVKITPVWRFYHGVFR